ncbi:hypothetical protein NECID01_0818 [Nematocida sp. AWRm77]|nr:hypothetical protein NECID01_0818 [Nematocida sp. AWRm77]
MVANLSHTRYVNFVECLALQTGTQHCTVSEWLVRHVPLLAVQILLESGKVGEGAKVLEKQARNATIMVKRDYIVPYITYLVQMKEKEKAHRALMEHLECNFEEAPYLFKLQVLLEGHLYLERRNLTGSKIWSRSVLTYLAKCLDFDVFVLARDIMTEVMLEEPGAVEKKLLSVMNWEEEAYLKSAETPKDLQMFEKVLKRHGLPTDALERAYIQRNPLANKDTIVKYFCGHPEDTELLEYVLERRKIAVLKNMAQERGVYTDAVKSKMEGFPWCLPEFTACMPPVSKEPEAQTGGELFAKADPQKKKKKPRKARHVAIPQIIIPSAFKTHHLGYFDEEEEWDVL